MRKRSVLTANPFVVFADIAIAVAFVFAMCSIALSKVFSDTTRDTRQIDMQKELISLLKEEDSAIKVDPDSRYRDQKRNMLIHTSVNEPLVGVHVNGSYQRIELDDMYEYGSTILKPIARQRLLKFAEILRRAMMKDTVSYLYFHGITEPGETRIYKQAHPNEAMDDKTLASIRAAGIYDLFDKEAKVIADTPGHAHVGNDSSAWKMDPRFVVDYGKAGLYQNSGEDPTTHKMHLFPGRVDLVLFYSDRPDVPPTK